MRRLVYGLGFLGFISAPHAYSWNYEIAPYAWASSLEGTEQTGTHRFHVSEPFSKLLKELDFGAMLYASAYHNNLGVFFNGIFSKVSDKTSLGNLNISSSSTMTIDGAGLSYRFKPNSQWVVEPYTGARYTLNDTKIGLNSVNIIQDYSWTDVIVGTRVNYNINTAFNIETMADYGWGRHSSSYNLTAALGYQSPNHFKNTRFFLGYRLLHQNYHHGEGDSYYEWDMNLLGPVAGFAYRW